MFSSTKQKQMQQIKYSTHFKENKPALIQNKQKYKIYNTYMSSMNTLIFSINNLLQIEQASSEYKNSHFSSGTFCKLSKEIKGSRAVCTAE